MDREVRTQFSLDRRTFQSPWSWACVANRCERRAVRSSRTSLATCTAHCGGNSRLLWPRPTENVVLGDDSVILHLQQIEFVTVNTSDQETKDLLEHAKDVFIGEYWKVQQKKTSRREYQNIRLTRLRYFTTVFSLRPTFLFIKINFLIFWNLTNTCLT